MHESKNGFYEPLTSNGINFNSWRRHITLINEKNDDELNNAWEEVKSIFNGGKRKRSKSKNKQSSSFINLNSSSLNEKRIVHSSINQECSTLKKVSNNHQINLNNDELIAVNHLANFHSLNAFNVHFQQILTSFYNFLNQSLINNLNIQTCEISEQVYRSNDFPFIIDFPRFFKFVSESNLDNIISNKIQQNNETFQ
jgi:hypothetical protein